MELEDVKDGAVEQDGGGDDRAGRAVALTSRDRELFLHLAFARHLSGAQIEELCFAGKSDSLARRRLRRLLEGRYIRRIPYRDSDGEPALAWALDATGYAVAYRTYSAIPSPAAHDVSPEFLEHDLRLNDLYIALTLAARAKKLPIPRRPFRWLPSTAARLPWREYDRETSAHEARIIRPDAVLELSASKRRIFVEAETGSHTLGFRSEHESKGSTKRKIERYTRFVADVAAHGARDTYYEIAFPDRFAPELLFVVPGESRRDAILDYVAKEWRPVNESVALQIRALTFDEAKSTLCGWAALASPSREAAPPATSIELAPVEARAIYDFYNSAISVIHQVRAFVQAHPAAGLALPEYPANHSSLRDLCMRIAGALK